MYVPKVMCGQLTGWERLVQEADGVELSSDTIKSFCITVMLDVQDALKRKDDLEREFLVGRVWP